MKLQKALDHETEDDNVEESERNTVEQTKQPSKKNYKDRNEERSAPWIPEK